MKVCKSQCSVFKDLYTAYVQGEAEKETMEWMKEHEKECSYCRIWAKEKEEVNVPPKEDENGDDFDEAKRAVKRVKVVMCVGMGLIIFMAMWMAIWLEV